MDAVAQTLWLCTAVLVVAASALSVVDHAQRGYRGFQWWVGALWLNAAGAGMIALLDASNDAPPMLQSLFVPWPLLCLLGLRYFHARSALPGSARLDLALLAALSMSASLTPLLAGATLSALAPPMACSAAALYAAFVTGSAPKSQDTPGLRVLSGLWLAMALLPAFGTAWVQPRHGAALHASIVTLGSVVMAFIVLTLSSQRTERELRESRRRLRVLANIDMLTQVPNRRRFEELARRALQSDEAGSAALLLVDIDHFKQINDMLGHAAGDRALKLVSRCTLELLRSHDVAGRHGGDEFVMLLRRSSTQDAMQVAERLVAHLQQQAHAHALPRLTLSFGIVQMRRGESIDETLQRADLALYEAKRLGRSRAVAADGDPQQPVFRSSQRLGLTSS
jgi:diguanylate cyclase (GGDEF)-like protein